ncbi:MAG TPA: hypothetical protein VNZ86_18820 [Bacteroidia bacterium]|jgi:hypothetical protein|nr:hypothetical protein [Bacteroidia bacterium]
MVLLQQETPSTLDSSAPTVLVCTVFVLYALMASGIIYAFGKLFFKKSLPSYLLLLLFALLGGAWGVAMHIYGKQYMIASASSSASSLGKMFSLFSLFTFVNMLVIPGVALIIINKNRKIRTLEEELKNNTK